MLRSSKLRVKTFVGEAHTCECSSLVEEGLGKDELISDAVNFELAEKTKNYLTKYEVDGVMARRDKIVATFQTLIAEKGEKEILY